MSRTAANMVTILTSTEMDGPCWLISGTAAIGIAEMIRCAKEFGLKARELKSSWARLARKNSLVEA